MSDIIELLTAFFQAAPALFSGIAILLAISAAVIVGHNGGAARRVRDSIVKLSDSIERSRGIIAEAERVIAESEQENAGALERVRDAKAGIEDALKIIRAIQDKNNGASNRADY